MKLFIFPHSGGFGHSYSFFQKYSFEHIDEVYAYDYPRKLRPESKVSNERDFSERVRAAAQWVLAHNVRSEEYLLFGHSMGAFVAYEVGMTLKKRGINPLTVVMSSQNPPTAFPKVRKEFENLYVDIDSFIKRLGGTSDGMSKKSMDFYKTLLMADLRLLGTYNPQIPAKDERLNDVIVLCGDDDPVLFPTYWGEWDLCSILYESFTYHGTHFYIYQHKDDVMRKIDKHIQGRET